MPIIIFTDGACKGNNQRSSALRQAGIGVVVIGTNKTAYGCRLEPKRYEYDDITKKVQPIEGTSEKITNNRAELFALCSAGEYIAANINLATTPVTIFCDNKICIDTITEFYPDRLKRGNDGTGLTNLDLVKIAHKLLFKANIFIIHVNSHQTTTPDMDMMTRIKINGNNYADTIAGNAAYYDTFDKVTIDVEMEKLLA